MAPDAKMPKQLFCAFCSDKLTGAIANPPP